MSADIKKRWLEDENFIKDLMSNKFEVDRYGLYDCRFDLRGMSIPKPKKIEKIYSYDKITGEFVIKNQFFENCDFSFADFSYITFIKCQFKNCLFEKTIFKNVDVQACVFVKCNFKYTNYEKSFLNTNIKNDSGKFLNCVFEKVNLSKTSFGFPIIDQCVFDNCILKETNFDGSRFSNTVFKGDFISGWFNGHSIYSKINGLFNRDKVENYPNGMRNVDFSDCNLIDVQFQNKINLSDCKFPEQDNFIKIYNLNKVYTELKSQIHSKVSYEEYNIITSWIDNLYYSQHKIGMNMDLINTECRTSYYKNELFDAFFGLLKDINTSYAKSSR